MHALFRYPQAVIPSLRETSEDMEAEEKTWLLHSISDTLDTSIRDCVIIHRRPWGLICKCALSNDQVIMHKIPHGKFQIEASVLKSISPFVAPDCIPTPIAVNRTTQSFVYKCIPRDKLREHVRQTYDYESLIEPVRLIADIQRSAELKRLPPTLDQISENVLVSKAEELLTHSDELLRPKLLRIKSALRRLFLTFGSRLEHGDFQDNNILFSCTEVRYSILDWGDAVISCPIFSLATYLHAAQMAHPELPARIIERIARAYGDVWALDALALRGALEDAHLVYPLVCLLKVARLDECSVDISEYREALTSYWVAVLRAL